MSGRDDRPGGVRGTASGAARRAMTGKPRLGAAFFLGGDSYPKDAHLEAALRQRLAPRFAAWFGQMEVLALSGAPKAGIAVSRRVADLTRVMDGMSPALPVFLFGRSSGARVATLLAAQRRVSGVVCFGYPFQRPDRDPEPERFAHLAGLDAPTLIFQGLSDPYSGAGGVRGYAVAETVQLRLIRTDHQVRLPARVWDLLCDEIAAFCNRAAGPPPHRGPGIGTAAVPGEGIEPPTF